MSETPWHWEPALVERRLRDGRELALPAASEIEQAESAQWRVSRSFGLIPDSQEGQVLLRHGFADWGDLYPRRQAHVLDALLGHIDGLDVAANVRGCLTLAVVGAAEMAGHASRWDRFYLKSYEAMAGHRFNFTTLAAEPHVWGAGSRGRGTVHRRLESFAIAADWMRAEIGAVNVSTPAAGLNGAGADVNLVVATGDSARLSVPDDSIELVITDPPYHDDVEYQVLSLPFQDWLNTSNVGCALPGSEAVSYRTALRRVFTEVERVLSPDGAMVLSFANRNPQAWTDFLAALESAGFYCRGFQIVHAENETDHAKRGRRACNYDLLVDLVPHSVPEECQFTPEPPSDDDVEARFVYSLGMVALQLGSLGEDWEDALVASLRHNDFLRDKKALLRSQERMAAKGALVIAPSTPASHIV